MQRNTNTAFFVTVLASCLGLLVIGVPPQVAARTVRDGVRYSTEALHSRLIVNAKSDAKSSYQTRRVAVENSSYFLAASIGKLATPESTTYQNSRALIENHRVLVITHLPRASLSDPLAIEPAEN